jgi:hypothetical protein
MKEQLPETLTTNVNVVSNQSKREIDQAEEAATRSLTLFEPDFKIHADRGSNCLKELDMKN